VDDERKGTDDLDTGSEAGDRDSDDEKRVFDEQCTKGRLTESDTSDDDDDDDESDDDVFICVSDHTVKCKLTYPSVDDPSPTTAPEYSSPQLNSLEEDDDWDEYHDALKSVPIAADFQRRLVCIILTHFCLLLF
jgi:hypothetical protein